MDEATEKTCTKCGESKPLGEFPKHPDCIFGVSARCKVCHGDAQRAYRAKRKEKRKSELLKELAAPRPCSRCGEVRQPDEFGLTLDLEHPEHHKRICNSCKREQVNKWAAASYARNRDAILNRKKRLRPFQPDEIVANVVGRSTKTCARCGEAKPFADFHRNTRRPDGRRETCAACTNEMNRVRRVENPEVERARNRRYRDEDPEKFRAAAREWQRRNPDRMREVYARRRARRRRQTVLPIDLTLLLPICGICGADIDESLTYPDPMSKSLDHIIPLSRGGAHSQENIQNSHLRCNIRKSDALPEIS